APPTLVAAAKDVRVSMLTDLDDAGPRGLEEMSCVLRRHGNGFADSRAGERKHGGAQRSVVARKAFEEPGLELVVAPCRRIVETKTDRDHAVDPLVSLPRYR